MGGDGDHVRLSVKEHRIDLLLPPDELAQRLVPLPPVPGGYVRLYRHEILQADHGCDFNFLRKHPLADAARE